MGDAVAETSPDGRYVRYSQVLGTGSFKTVYKAFDTEDALEVAWNKLHVDRLTDKELENVQKEVELLEKIHHKNVIRFHAFWRGKRKGDGGAGGGGRETLDFITELMMSGTLREYLKKAKAVKIKVLRRWCCNILEAIAYLHAQNPPIMHRDIKCDNIFINGHVGEVKIGDLGLSSSRVKERAESVIGTPEFMAPELYEESYTEKLDIYSFGMCMLELVTMEYPYSECTNPAQIFKKVTGGLKPKVFHELIDGEVKEVIGACLRPEKDRPSAAELLAHPLFRDWESDDGRRSNLSLIYGTPENLELEGALNGNLNSVGDWRFGAGMIDHSDALHRAMFVSKEAAPEEGGQDVQVRASQNKQGEIRIAVMIPVSDGLKRIEFPFDMNHDSVPKLARELISEVGLPKEMLGTIQAAVEKQVTKAVKQHRKQIERQQVEAAQNMENSVTNSIEGIPGTAIPKGSKLREQRNGHASKNASEVRGNQKHSANHVNQNGKEQHRRQASVVPDAPKENNVSHRNNYASQKVATKPSIVVVQKSKDALEVSNQSVAPNGNSNRIRKRERSVDRHGSGNEYRQETIIADVGNEERIRALNLKLMEQSAAGKYTAVLRILDNGGSPAFTDFDGRTPLHVAAAEGHPAICDILLKQGAPWDAKDRWGNTPLDCAREHEAFDDVLGIFEQYGGADEFEREPDMSRVNLELMHFASLGLMERVREKLVAGASVRFADDDSRTPLHLACANGHVLVVELLLLNGASSESRDRYNHTAVDNAVANGHKDVLRVLRQYGAELPRHLLNLGRDRKQQMGIDLCEYSGRGEVRAVKNCIRRGAKVNFRDLDERTPLHLACACGHILVVDALLRAGADMTLRDRWGSTPQQEAANNGHANIVDFLAKFRRIAAGGKVEGELRSHAQRGRTRSNMPNQDHLRRLQREVSRSLSISSIAGLDSDEFVIRARRRDAGSGMNDVQYSEGRNGAAHNPVDTNSNNGTNRNID